MLGECDSRYCPKSQERIVMLKCWVCGDTLHADCAGLLLERGPFGKTVEFGCSICENPVTAYE